MNTLVMCDSCLHKLETLNALNFYIAFIQGKLC